MTLRKFLKHLSGSLAVCTLLGTGFAQESLVTGASRFQIPFDVETEPGETLQGFAVLYGSQDGGKTWDKLQSVPAAQQNFQFAAPRDGVYAFAVRMTDAQGNLQTAIQGSQPELLVTVDTKMPDLRLELHEVTPGQVMVHWQITDMNADISTLKLEYTEGQDGRWKTLSAEPAITGQKALQVPPGSVVSVRGTVSDLGGNRGSGSSQAVLRSVVAPPTVPSTSVPGVSGEALTVRPMGTTPFAGVQPNSGFGGLSGPGVQMPLTAGTVPASVPPLNMRQSAAPSAGTVPAVPNASESSMPVLDFGSTGVAASAPAEGPSAEWQLVRDRVFDLVYQLDDVGPSGVGSVELFVTEDSGKQWFRYGNDDDLRSPFQVDVQGEGVFGFAVRVRNGLGFADPPPQPGEPPAIVVAVDQTPPTVEFPQPTVSAKGDGAVNLKWNVAERYPASAPIRLEYAASAAGPWTPLFDWQADAGSYQWPVRPGTPSALYFRLLARDAAGNVASAQTSQPVLIDLKRPTVSGLRVQTVSDPRGVSRGF